MLASGESKGVARACGSERNAGWLSTALASILPYLIYVPWQLYRLVTYNGWKTLLKQIRFGSISSSSGASLSLTAPYSGFPRHQLHQEGGGSHQLSPYLELVRADNVAAPRRLVLLLTWLTARPQHVVKYSSIFTKMGVDVLKVQITPMDLMQPTARAQVASQQILDFLQHNQQFERVLVFGFSVGAYVFCESVKKIHNNLGMYGNLLDRFVGHIWDSPVDLQNMPIGMAKTVTDNASMQYYIVKYVEWFLKVRHDVATRHYITASRHMHQGPLSAPGLFIYCPDDPMSPGGHNEGIIDEWKRGGMTVMSHAFPRAPHVASFNRYPGEYMGLLRDFLSKVDFAEEQLKPNKQHVYA